MTEALEKSVRYRRRFCVRTYESDLTGRLRPESLLDYFQEAAGEHAEELGAGVRKLMERNLTWVISRYHIRLIRSPRWKSPVDLTTWPSIHRRLFALREFELKDQKGSLLAAATSSWMLIDIKTKRPVPLAEHLGPFPRDPVRAVASAFPPLPALERADLEKTFRVRMSDLDWNRHVNHVVYIAWALETAPVGFIEKHRPAEIEVDFRGEALYEETVVCRMQKLSKDGAPLFGYRIDTEDGRKELARLRILWQG